MAEIGFYQLTSTPLERALPKLLEKAIQSGFRTLVKLESNERAEAISSALWNYDPASFLAHGTAKDGAAEEQPIYLTAEAENPNQADMLVVTDASELEDQIEFKRVLDMFDGSDEKAVQAARTRYSLYKKAGHNVTYYQQDEKGTWRKPN